MRSSRTWLAQGGRSIEAAEIKSFEKLLNASGGCCRIRDIWCGREVLPLQIGFGRNTGLVHHRVGHEHAGAGPHRQGDRIAGPRKSICRRRPLT